MTATVYHISLPQNIASILQNGLLPNDSGKIFFFDDVEDAPKIALDQCGLMQFSIFMVCAETFNFKLDEVAELIKGNQYFTQNIAIPKENIKFITCKGITL